MKHRSTKKVAEAEKEESRTADYLFQLINTLILAATLCYSVNVGSIADKTLRAAYVPWIRISEAEITQKPGEKPRLTITIENKSTAPALDLVPEGAIVPQDGATITTFNGRAFDQSMVLPGSTKGFVYELPDPSPGFIYNSAIEKKISFRFFVKYQDAFKHPYTLEQEFSYRENKLRPIHTYVRGLDELLKSSLPFGFGS